MKPTVKRTMKLKKRRKRNFTRTIMILSVLRA
jgi:hypothetical protein